MDSPAFWVRGILHTSSNRVKEIQAMDDTETRDGYNGRDAVGEGFDELQAIWANGMECK
jgi:hypothetical protein